MSPLYLGVDTSNYTTSCALYHGERGEIIASMRQPLPVREGQIGLRQNDAVYLHVQQLGELLEKLFREISDPVAAVGVSATPLDADGSFMPCFLSGVMAAQGISAALGVPLHRFSHQAGHLMAALYGVGRTELAEQPFLAFHLSGGTTQGLLVRPGEHSPFRVELLCETLDLKAGQLVDRVGAMLGLPFPAGPRLEELAARSDKQFRPKPTLKGNNCCLSGVENQCRDRLAAGEAPEDVANFCISSLREALLAMTGLVAAEHPDLPLVYAGGVMANAAIREAVCARYPASFAPPQFSADNAAGAAILASLGPRQEGTPCSP